MTRHDLRLTRRAALQGAAGLVIALHLPHRASRAQTPAQPFAPNAFVRVDTDDTVTVLVKHGEFGQGPLTGLTTLVAEEMDADWSQMRAEHAPADAALYQNLAFSRPATDTSPAFNFQGTGGSTAIANSYEQMRRAGGVARAMLVQAAALEWKVPADEITIEYGVLRHSGSGREGGSAPLRKPRGNCLPSIRLP